MRSLSGKETNSFNFNDSNCWKVLWRSELERFPPEVEKEYKVSPELEMNLEFDDEEESWLSLLRGLKRLW